MKRLVCTVLAAALAVSALAGCGRKNKTDYYMKGYAAVEEGRYEAALKDFQTAAKAGDDQAQKAADIVSGYLNAQEAFALGDAEGAKAFLKDIPEDYKYYAIGEDIDTLRRRVYSAGGEDRPEETPRPSASASAAPTASAAADKENGEKDFSKREEIDLELQQIRELVEEGYLDQAEERLDGLNSASLTDGQKRKADQYREEIAEQRREHKKDGSQDDAEFTADKAVEYVREAYGLQGDPGDDPAPRYDSGGKKYYELVIQSGEGASAEILTLHIYSGGEIRIVDRR